MNENQKRFLLSMLAYAVQRGVSPEQLCTLSNIDLQAIKKGDSITITKRNIDDLWLNASRLCNDPLFGLHFGESLQLAALGIVGEIIQSSRTVGEAVTIAASLINLITDQFRMEVTQSSKTFTIRLVPTSDAEKDSSFTFRQLRDFLMVFTIHELDGLLLQRIAPQSVKLPEDVSGSPEYERVLRCKPRGKAGEYAMEFDLVYWHEPILTANYELQGILLQKVHTQVKNELIPVPKLKERIHNYLLSNAYLGILSIEEIAGNFNMSPRSLQRKLQEEGVTYQQLADAVRKSLALHYIKSGNYQIKEISNMLGYNEISAFTRAFKRWTGKAPVSYRS